MGQQPQDAESSRASGLFPRRPQPTDVESQRVAWSSAVDADEGSLDPGPGGLPSDDRLNGRHRTYVFNTTYLRVDERKFDDLLAAIDRGQLDLASDLYLAALGTNATTVAKGHAIGGRQQQVPQVVMDVLTLLPSVAMLFPGLKAALGGTIANAGLLFALPFIATVVGQIGLYLGELSRSGGFSNRNKTIKDAPYLDESLRGIYVSLKAMHASTALLTRALDNLQVHLDAHLEAGEPSPEQTAALQVALDGVLNPPDRTGDGPPPAADPHVSRAARWNDRLLPTELAYALGVPMLEGAARPPPERAPIDELAVTKSDVAAALRDRAIRERNDNTYYFGKMTQTLVSVSRQVLQYLAPLMGEQWAEGVKKPQRAAAFSLLIQAMVLLATRAVQIGITAPRDEAVSKNPRTQRLTLETTQLRDSSGAPDKTALRKTWRMQDAVRMQNVSDKVKARIANAQQALARTLQVSEDEIKEFEKANGFNFDPLMPELTDSEHVRLVELRARCDPQGQVGEVSRNEFLERIELERRANEPLTREEEAERKALEASFAASSMSHADWHEWVSGGQHSIDTEHRQLIARIDANGPESLSDAEALRFDELKSWIEAADKSLTPLQHVRLEALRVRPPPSADAASTEDGTTHTAHGEIPTEPGAVGGLNERFDIDWIAPTVADPRVEKLHFLAAGDPGGKHMLACTALSNACNDPRSQRQLRELVGELTEARLDSRFLQWDWSRTSDTVKKSIDDLYLDGKGNWGNAIDIANTRLRQRNHFVPAFMQRWAAYFLLGFGGSATTYAANQGLKLARTLLFPQGADTPEAQESLKNFLTIRADVRLAMLGLAVIGASSAGFLSQRNADVRRKYFGKGEQIPPLAVMLLTELLYGMFIAVPSQVAQRTIRGPAAKATAWLGMRQTRAVEQEALGLVDRTRARLATLAAPPESSSGTARRSQPAADASDLNPAPGPGPRPRPDPDPDPDRIEVIRS
jgi:hypothetical protein